MSSGDDRFDPEDSNVFVLIPKPPPTLEQLDVQVIVLCETMERVAQLQEDHDALIESLLRRVSELERRGSGPHNGVF